MQLAQINIAEMLAPIDDPIMGDFVNNLDRINLLAEQSDGFIWRLKEDDTINSSTIFDNIFLIINMSVWRDKIALHNYVYKTAHADILKRKKEWFHKFSRMHMALWYIKDGHKPTLEEAKERLYYLQEHGDTPYAFTFKSEYTEQNVINYSKK